MSNLLIIFGFVKNLSSGNNDLIIVYNFHKFSIFFFQLFISLFQFLDRFSKSSVLKKRVLLNFFLN